MRLIFTFLLAFTFSLGISLKEVETLDNAIKVAKDENKKILFFVYSEYCPWCDKMKDETLSNDKAIKFINDKFVFVRASKELDDIPKEFNPRFIPTTYLIDPNTKDEIYALYGFKHTNELIEELEDE
jgi:thioredoxin-related protein